MTTQEWMWVGIGIALGVVLMAGIADWRRTHKRHDIDDIGWIPWRGIQVTAFFGAALFLILALKG